MVQRKDKGSTLRALNESTSHCHVLNGTLTYFFILFGFRTGRNCPVLCPDLERFSSPTGHPTSKGCMWVACLVFGKLSFSCARDHTWDHTRAPLETLPLDGRMNSFLGSCPYFLLHACLSASMVALSLLLVPVMIAHWSEDEYRSNNTSWVYIPWWGDSWDIALQSWWLGGARYPGARCPLFSPHSHLLHCELGTQQ